MSRKSITQTIVQYFEDPKESDILAQIKKISDQAKNKSSRNLICVDTHLDKNDDSTEVNTAHNKNLFKENDKNEFHRRKYKFATQTFRPKISYEIKKKANLKKWNASSESDENEKDDIIKKRQKNKKVGKRVNFFINKDENKNENNTNQRIKYDHKTFNPNASKVKGDSDINDLIKKRKSSSDDADIITHRIVRYLDNPKDSEALAKVKELSNQAKNKSGNNLVHINPDDIHCNKSNDIFKRRKFQFPTQVYKPKKNHLSLAEEINARKNMKNKKEENDSDVKSCEDDEEEDSGFDLEKIDNKEEEIKEEKIEPKKNKDNYEKKENTYNNVNENSKNDNAKFSKYNYYKYKNKLNNLRKESQLKEEKNEEINYLKKVKVEKNEELIDVIKPKKEKKEEKKEEKNPIIYNDKNRNSVHEKYTEIDRPKSRERYSSHTYNVNELSKFRNNQKGFTRTFYRFDSITEEYKMKNNLSIETINNKEKVIKSEYRHKDNDGKKKLKTYKTEYFWDKMINRLIEKRIYIDENEEPKVNYKNNEYRTNTFNPFNKYRKDFENREKENNVTHEKIELDTDNRKEKENNIVKENPYGKKNVYSRKYKYMPRLYTANTFNARNMSNNNNNKDKKESNPNKETKPSYRLYQKRPIISDKDETRENNYNRNLTDLHDNAINNKYVKIFPKKEVEVNRKVIFSKKVIESNKNKSPVYPNTNPETKKAKIKNEEFKYKKINKPYSSINNNSQNELKNRTKNNVFSNYMKSKNTVLMNNRKNITNNDSELIEDLKKIEKYSITTYLKKDLMQIYDHINEEYQDFKKDIFNTNLNDFESKMGEFDKNNENNSEFVIKKYKFNVKDLCKEKTTLDDIIKKYSKRSINIESGVYNKK